MPLIRYKLKDGTSVSGVTTIISGNLGWNTRPLMHWSWQQGIDGKDYKEVSKEACDAGSLVHKQIEHDLKGKGMVDVSKYTPEVIQKAKTAYEAWLEWKSLVDFKVLASELSLVSEEHNFGGTIDVAAVKNKTCILDLKSSNATYADHLIQLSAYGKLYEECRNDKIEAYYLLRLGKEDGSFHYSYWPELSNGWKAFEHLLELHKLQKVLKRMT